MTNSYLEIPMKDMNILFIDENLFKVVNNNYFILCLFVNLFSKACVQLAVYIKLYITWNNGGWWWSCGLVTKAYLTLFVVKNAYLTWNLRKWQTKWKQWQLLRDYSLLTSMSICHLKLNTVAKLLLMRSNSVRFIL